MIEIMEKEKIVISKPVARRPHFSNLKSFSDILSVTTGASPSAAFTETDVALVKPTTLRFKTDSSIDLVRVAEVHGSAACHPSENAPESNVVCNVVYKPVAKLLSRTTFSLLSNLGGNAIAPKHDLGEVGNTIQSTNQATHQTDSTLAVNHNFPTHSEQRTNATIENYADETKSLIPTSSRDRPSYDGHNWRKYGQKQVKGSDYPRSYYKCTYPNCPVKKKVEKTLDGQIAEIVYKGEHNHLRPQQPSHTPSDAHVQTTADDIIREEEQSHVINQHAEIAKAHLDRSENRDFIESSTFSGTPPIPVASTACNAGPSVSNNTTGECEEVCEIEAEGGNLRNKRKKRASKAREASSDPQIVVRNNTDSVMVGDGFRWRKYGQKVVKGKMYPRSYYRCTNPDCNVRKYVERTFEDPSTFITTYEGKHNHAMPLKSPNAEASKTSAIKK